MKKFISLILFIGLLGCLSLLIPKSIDSACPPSHGDYTYTDPSGKEKCCKTPDAFGKCKTGEDLHAGYCCIFGSASFSGSPSPGSGLFGETTVWLTVDRHNVMVGQSFTGTLKIITKENIAHPSVNYGDGESIWFISDCDGSDLLGDPEADPLICEYDFTHNYLTPGSKIIKGGYSSQVVEKTITVLEAPIPDPGPDDDWNPIESKTISKLIEKITNLVFYLVSSLAVLFIMMGGFYVLTATGNPEQINKGRKIILYTIIGFTIMSISRGIIALIYLILRINIP